MVAADYINPDALHLILSALMPANRLALQTSEFTGLRIGDVLALRTAQLRSSPRFTVHEEKTGKARRIYIPKLLREALLRQAGRFYVFENRLDPAKHRTRAAVYKDLRRVAKLYRIEGHKLAEHVSPHTARKVYAVSFIRQGGSISALQERLNHSDRSVTMLYALADAITARSHPLEKTE